MHGVRQILIVIGQADQTPVNLTETGEPVRFFRALKGETIVSISAVADASEPGPNGDPPGDLGQFMVFRSGPTNQALAVAYSISGTATNGVDYTELPGSITIPVGEESALISVEALYDDLAEFDETVTLTLELTGEYLIDPAYCEATVTIQCNAFVAVAELDGPVGIDYHGPLNSLIVSYNYATGGNPRNFARIDSNGQVTPWSLVSNLLEEVKVATAKQTASGWQQGQLYFGLGIGAGAEGEIGQVSTDGTGVTLNWADLPLPPGEFFRGSLAFDQTGILGGDLIAVTGGPDEQAGHARSGGSTRLEHRRSLRRLEPATWKAWWSCQTIRCGECGRERFSPATSTTESSTPSTRAARRRRIPWGFILRISI